MNTRSNVLTMTLITLGVYLIWCGFTDRSPVEVLKTVMQGDYKNLPESGSWSNGFNIGGGSFPPLPGSDKTPPNNSGPPPVSV